MEVASSSFDFSLIWSRIKFSLWRLRRYIPFLVWKRQPVQVHIEFDMNKIEKNNLPEIKRLFYEMGIDFDTGYCFSSETFDWEFDYSLEGPIKVTFVDKDRS